MKALFLCLLLISLPTLATPITHLVVFGDSFSDRGYSSSGGFNRNSNGPIWAEYLADPLCKTCLEDHAWSGAKSDMSNYHGFQWSGLLWQIEHYKMTSNPKKTLHFIWIGINDLFDGKAESKQSANNILVGINQLIAKGAQHIIVFSLPDYWLAPPYVNADLHDYQTFSLLQQKVKKGMLAHNEILKKLIQLKKKELAKKKINIFIYLIDFSDFFYTNQPNYQYTKTPWLGTYSFPTKDAYMWWDAWHPMTSIHERISKKIKRELAKKDFTLITD